MARRSVLWRLPLAGVGLLTVSIAGLVLSNSLDITDAIGLARYPFSPAWERFSDEYERAEPSRERSLHLTEENGNWRARWTLDTSEDDPIAEAVSAGGVADRPWQFSGEIADLQILRDDESTYVSADSGAPTVSQDGETTSVESTATLDVRLGDVLRLRPGCFECEVRVEVDLDEAVIVGLAAHETDYGAGGAVEPAESVDPVETVERTASSAVLVLPEGDVDLTVGRAGQSLSQEPQELVDLGYYGSRIRDTWQNLAFALPWFLLLIVSIPLNCGVVARRSIGLSLAGLLLAVFVSISYDLELLLRDLAGWIQARSSGVEFIGASPGVAAATLLGVVWAGIALTYLARGRVGRVYLRTYLFVIFAAGAVVTALAAGWVIPTDFMAAGATPGPPATPIVVGLALAAAGCFLVAHMLGRGFAHGVDQALVAVAGAAAVGAMASMSQAGSPFSAWGAGGTTIALDAVFLATLIALPVTVLRPTPTEGTDKQGRARRGLAWAALLILCIWIALPQRRYSFALAPVDRIDVFRVVGATVPAARVALFVTLLVYLWRLSREGWGRDGTRIRTLAWAAGAVMILRPDVLFGGLPVSFIAGVLLLWWALVPPVVADGDGDADAVARVVSHGRQQRLLEALTRGLEQKVVAGDKSVEDARNEIAAAQAGGVVLDEDPLPEQQASERGRAFGHGGPSPWRRGVFGAGVAAVAGLPGFVQALAALSTAGELDGSVPILSAASTVVLVLRYPLYGFFFGYFFPCLRGETGVHKAFSFAAVLGVSEALALLLPYQQNEDVVSALVAWGAQIFLICYALGLAFDFRTLRSAGLGIRSLLDVHHTSRTVAFSSAVLASVATGLVTALASSAVTVIASRLGGG